MITPDQNSRHYHHFPGFTSYNSLCILSFYPFHGILPFWGTYAYIGFYPQMGFLLGSTHSCCLLEIFSNFISEYTCEQRSYTGWQYYHVVLVQEQDLYMMAQHANRAVGLATPCAQTLQSSGHKQTPSGVSTLELCPDWRWCLPQQLQFQQWWKWPLPRKEELCLAGAITPGGGGGDLCFHPKPTPRSSTNVLNVSLECQNRKYQKAQAREHFQ